MKPSQIAAALSRICPTKRACYIWGAPGVGKSGLVKQLARDTDRRLVDWRMLYRDPVDSRGIPNISTDLTALVSAFMTELAGTSDAKMEAKEWLTSAIRKVGSQWVTKNGQTVWNPPSDWPTSGKGVFFMDELAQSPPMMQQLGAQIGLERRCGDTPLGDDWWVICASNRAEDRAGTHRLISNASTRFIHYDMEVSLDDWRAWAVTAGIHPAIITFLWKMKPDHLFAFDPTARCSAIPRTWEFASDALQSFPAELFTDLPATASQAERLERSELEHICHHTLAGCVSEAKAAELTAYLRFHRQLPDVDAVLANPTTAAVPKDPSVLYALSGVIVHRMRTADAALLGRAAQYATRMSDEFSVLTVRDIGAALESQKKGNAAKFLGLPQIGVWLKSHRHLLLQQGN